MGFFASSHEITAAHFEQECAVKELHGVRYFVPSLSSRICGVWTEIYAAASLLEYVMANPEEFRGRSIASLGSGGGVLEIGLAKLGAFPIAVDYDPRACFGTRQNARLNGVDFRVIEGDVMSPFFPMPECDMVIACDLFYGGSYAGKVARRVLKLAAGRPLYMAANDFNFNGVPAPLKRLREGKHRIVRHDGWDTATRAAATPPLWLSLTL